MKYYKTLAVLLYLIINLVLFPAEINKLSIPLWFLNPPKENNSIFAEGFAKKKSSQMALVSAGDAARSEISRVLSVKINTITKSFLESAKVKNRDLANEFSETASELVSANTLYFSRIEKQEAVKIDDMTAAYVLIKLDLDEMNKAVDGTLVNLKDQYDKMEPARKLEDLSIQIKDKIEKELGSTSISKNEKQLQEILQAQENKPAEKISGGRKPSWTTSFPSSGEYYIGIGQGNDLDGAKNSAVNAIAAQIEVNVKSEINDYVKEVNKVTSEDISQNIKLTVREDFEDLETVELWNSAGDGFWAYYRLNIQKFKAREQQRMENAIINGLDFLAKCDSEKDPALKIKYAFLGYYLAGKYATRALKADYKGSQIILVNELISRIQKSMSGISIKPFNQDVEIDSINPKAVELKYAVYNNDAPLSNFPVIFIKSKGELKISGRSVTDSAGIASCILSRSDSREQIQSFIVQLDLDSFMQDSTENEEELSVFNRRIEKLGIPAKEIVVKINAPVFNFNLKISNDLTADPKYKSLVDGMAGNFRNSLMKSIDAKFTDNKEKLVLNMSVDGSISKSSLSGQFFTRLGVIISIVDNSTGKEIFSKSTPGQGIKGGSITVEKSLRAAIDKYLQEYNEDFVKSIVEFTNGK